MDFDVEALLEAPFQAKKKERTKSRERRHDVVSGRDAYYTKEYRRDGSSDSRRPPPPPPRREQSMDYNHRRDRRDRSPEFDNRSHARHDRSVEQDSRHHVRKHSRDAPPAPPEESRALVRSKSSDSFEGAPDPSITEIERNARTVLVTQLAARLTSKEFANFFAPAGRVRDVRIVMDKNTGRSKGVGYVEFCDPSSVQAAVALSGQKLLGVPVSCQASGAEKNYTGEMGVIAYAAHAAVIPLYVFYPTISSMLATEDTSQRIYIGDLHHNFTEHDVHQIFELLGDIEYVNLQKDSRGDSKGYCYVQFKSSHDAKAALDRMNGYELGGRNIKVELVKDDSGHIYEQPSALLKTTIRENDPEWDKDIELTLRAKLAKYGEMESVFVDKYSNNGDTYIKFEKLDASKTAQRALDGRFFAMRQIACFFLTSAAYTARFPVLLT